MRSCDGSRFFSALHWLFGVFRGGIQTSGLFFSVFVKKKYHWNFMSIALNLQMALCSMDTLTALFQSMDTGYLSICVFFDFFYQSLVVFLVQIFYLLG